ncbi:MAG: hypothetical protein V3T21_00755 [Candidatus Margulisiibacteriota bacterium]
MNYIKKLMLVFIAVNVLVAPGFAGLIEDVDDLTPEGAVLLEKKLQQKRFEAATPENSRIAGFIQYIKPTQFNSAFPGVSPMTNLYGGSFDLRKPLSERVLIGGSFGGAGNYVISESSSKIYEDLFLAYGQAQFVVDLRIFQNKTFVLSITPGAGIMLGGYNYSKTDDNSQTFYNTNRWGSGICTSLSLDAVWKVYKDWGLGFGVSSFSGKLGGMRKVASSVDSSAPEIDLTGTTFRISGSKVF